MATLSTTKPLQVFCLYASQGGSTKKLAEAAQERLSALFAHDETFSCEVEDLATFNPDILVTQSDDLVYAGDDSNKNSLQNRQIVALFFVSSYYGKAPKSCLPFQKWLEDFALDFRVSRNAMKNLFYSIFSVGDSDFSKNLDELERQLQKEQSSEANSETIYSKSGGLIGSKFNAFGKFLNKNISKLEGRRLLSLCLADKGTSVTDKSPFEKQFERWMKKCENVLSNLEKKKNLPGFSKQLENSAQQDEDSDLEDDNVAEAISDGENDSDPDDIEELIPNDTTGMVSMKLREELKKQGYFLVGKNKHSAVKLCRWAKAQVRGRGACYKHTAYGIQSYHCMEMTASIGCANKCVFCWRHHSNPVVTGWKDSWITNGLTDSPKEIFEGAVKAQTHLIKSLRGVPGAKLDRYKDALEKGPRHAALSLIGEPIIYPYINELIDYMHESKISTFMVTNAQFPEKIQQLNPVTQLYISVDAPSPDELARVDRPIFEDFWQRLNKSIEIIGQKSERTVYRFTLVKGWNSFGLDTQQQQGISTDKIEISSSSDQIADIQAENYAKLIWKGKPDFVEVKGMTYSGNAKNDIQITNVPYFTEIDDFSKLIVKKLKVLQLKEGGNSEKDVEYDLAVAHEHTLFVLVANKKKFFDANTGKWKTWIDFDKFFELYKQWKQDDTKKFEVKGAEYCLETPEWAVYGATEKGFDPSETRFREKPTK